MVQGMDKEVLVHGGWKEGFLPVVEVQGVPSLAVIFELDISGT